MPLSFVPNAGQVDRRVRYSAQAGGASFFFTKREAVFSFPKGKKKGVALRLRFPGADPQVRISGKRRASGTVNYLIGYDPAGWHTNLPTYGELVYHDLWPGIDLRFRGEHGQLKYEFLVKPGADAGAIRLAYRGAEGLSLDKRGNLRLETALGSLTDSRPVSHQQRDSRLLPVASRFVLAPGRDAYGFALGQYDRSRPLIIDPGLVYSTYLGGSDRYTGDHAAAIAVDSAGDAYVTGATGSADFPTTAGAFDTSFHGGVYGDVFVTKLNAAGSELLYSTYLGGSDGDSGDGIGLDGAGSAYLTGNTASSNFPVTSGAFDTSQNSRDAFVTKLNPAGSELRYSTYLGGSDEDFAQGVAVDAAGEAHVAGYTWSADFPTTAGAVAGGNYDAFVTKLSAAGSKLLYSSYLGGVYGDYGQGTAVGGEGSTYLAGSTNSPNFPTTGGAFDTTANGEYDTFVTKLDTRQPPPPPQPVRRCVVPRVIGLRLAKARARIRRSNCRVGRVRRARSRRVGRVVKQSPRAGSRRARGARVNLVVGRR